MDLNKKPILFDDIKKPDRINLAFCFGVLY